MNIGDKVTWRHEMKGGYGYVEYIPGVVKKINAKTVSIEVELKAGGRRIVRVKPENLKGI